MYLFIMLIGLALVFIPQWWVKSTVGRFAQVGTLQGLSGAEVARRILAAHNLLHVRVEETPGELSDHYDPSDKAVRLSPEIYQGQSVSACAIAAHECGHALQHASGFVPVVIRSAMVPAVNLGSQLGPLLMMGSILLMTMKILNPDLGLLVGLLGVLLFGLAVLFHFVTLPVEIDASLRAVKVLEGSGFLTTEELPGAKRVLTAAACTYVATALYALIQLLYWLGQLLGSRNRE